MSATVFHRLVRWLLIAAGLIIIATTIAVAATDYLDRRAERKQ